MAKKVIVYGSADCPHCVDAKEVLDREGIRYGYVDILAGLGHLKKFLNLRDANPELYKDIVEKGKVGIPTIVVDDTDIYVETIENLDIGALR